MTKFEKLLTVHNYLYPDEPVKSHIIKLKDTSAFPPYDNDWDLLIPIVNNFPWGYLVYNLSLLESIYMTNKSLEAPEQLFECIYQAIKDKLYQRQMNTP